MIIIIMIIVTSIVNNHRTSNNHHDIQYARKYNTRKQDRIQQLQCVKPLQVVGQIGIAHTCRKACSDSASQKDRDWKIDQQVIDTQIDG